MTGYQPISTPGLEAATSMSVEIIAQELKKKKKALVQSINLTFLFRSQRHRNGEAHTFEKL